MSEPIFSINLFACAEENFSHLALFLFFLPVFLAGDVAGILPEMDSGHQTVLESGIGWAFRVVCEIPLPEILPEFLPKSFAVFAAESDAAL